jgi:hypothetical protein
VGYVLSVWLFNAQVSLPNSLEIQAIFLADVVLNNHEYTQDELNAQLRWLTGYVVGVGMHAACYPLGYPQTLLFDEFGEPL